MQISVIGRYSLLVVRLSGEIDHHKARETKEAIDRELMRRGVRNLAIDFSDVGFMDSSGLGLIMGRYKKISAIGGKMAVCGMNDRIKKIFKMCGLQKIVIMTDKLEDAAEELNGGI